MTLLLSRVHLVSLSLNRVEDYRAALSNDNIVPTPQTVSKRCVCARKTGGPPWRVWYANLCNSAAGMAGVRAEPLPAGRCKQVAADREDQARGVFHHAQVNAEFGVRGSFLRRCCERSKRREYIQLGLEFAVESGVLSWSRFRAYSGANNVPHFKDRPGLPCVKGRLVNVARI